MIIKGFPGNLPKTGNWTPAKCQALFYIFRMLWFIKSSQQSCDVDCTVWSLFTQGNQGKERFRKTVRAQIQVNAVWPESIAGFNRYDTMPLNHWMNVPSPWSTVNSLITALFLWKQSERPYSKILHWTPATWHWRTKKYIFWHRIDRN